MTLWENGNEDVEISLTREDLLSISSFISWFKKSFFSNDWPERSVVWTLTLKINLSPQNLINHQILIGSDQQ